MVFAYNSPIYSNVMSVAAGSNVIKLCMEKKQTEQSVKERRIKLIKYSLYLLFIISITVFAALLIS